MVRIILECIILEEKFEKCVSPLKKISFHEFSLWYFPEASSRFSRSEVLRDSSVSGWRNEGVFPANRWWIKLKVRASVSSFHTLSRPVEWRETVGNEETAAHNYDQWSIFLIPSNCNRFRNRQCIRQRYLRYRRIASALEVSWLLWISLHLLFTAISNNKYCLCILSNNVFERRCLCQATGDTNLARMLHWRKFDIL